MALARERGVPARHVGESGGERLVVGPPAGTPWIDVAVEGLETIWSRAIPRRVEEG